MIVKCPVCDREWECETPGKYQCECGAKFYVAADGSTSTSKPTAATAQSQRTVRVDVDKTIPPLTTHDDTAQVRDAAFDPDRTVVNMRIRRERGELQVGDVVLGRYELWERLGSGAMGVVFKCRDQVSQVEYALKMVPPELARDADAMEEVRENFQLVHGLKHPNIASVDFLDRDEYGAYFLIMEFAKGESLTQWIKRKWKSGRPELKEVADIIKQVAAALDYAHSQKILHRDVKPANVMIDEQGDVKVLDFGLASKVRNTMTALSINPANTSGTPNYLSPEQFKGKYPTPASDQYALGVLTYQMLAGQLPFDSDDFNVLRAAVNSEKPDDIDGIPGAVNKCLQKVLAKDPQARFASCTAFANALEGSKNTPSPSQISQAAPPSRPTNPADPQTPPDAASVMKARRRNKYYIAIAVVFGLIIAVVQITGNTQKRQKNQPADELPRQTEERHQDAATCRADQKPSVGDRVLELPGKVQLALVKVEAGTFAMGSPSNEEGRSDDETQHRVTLTEDFYIGKTEVTQAQWRAVMGTAPSDFRGDDRPVECVSWYDAMAFCKKLNEMGKAPKGMKFTLPTETQWEFAARGGNKSRGYKYAGSNDLAEVAWYDGNSGDKTHPVATKRANELGLYDMSGNVWEWCLDWYETGYARDPEFLTGNSGSNRVDRGGGWGVRTKGCRSAFRYGDDPGSRYGYLGFRLALVQDRGSQAEARRAETARRQTEERRQEEARRQEEERRIAEERRQEEERREIEEHRHAEVRRRQILSTGDRVLELPGDVKLALVKVEAYTFKMGSPLNETGHRDDEAQHYVTLTKDFYIGKTEVTQEQYKAVMGYNPSKLKGDDRPVERVSSENAMEFCKKLNEMGKAPEGWKFTLPTEAQWEYAARGGNKSGGYKYAGSNDLAEVAWYDGNSGDRTLPVATKQANELGLYDMSGNVYEWCLDWFQTGYARDPEFLTGNGGYYRVNRGGSRGSRARDCRSASRFSDPPGEHRSNLGFRLALVQIK